MGESHLLALSMGQFSEKEKEVHRKKKGGKPWKAKREKRCSDPE